MSHLLGYDYNLYTGFEDQLADVERLYKEWNNSYQNIFAKCGVRVTIQLKETVIYLMLWKLESLTYNSK